VIVKQPAELSNADFSANSPTEQMLSNRGGTSTTLNDRAEGVLNRGQSSGPSLPRVGQNQPQVQQASLAAPVTNVVTTFQTTQFLDDDPGELLDFKDAGTTGIYQVISPDISLQKFLERPVHIRTYTWDTSWTDQNFSPWYDFLNTQEIENKLINFSYIRGRLKLKFVLNASPFFYGAMRANYLPLWGLIDSGISTAPSGGSPLIPRSQMPGLFLYPQTSTGGEMELPFFYHKDYLALKTSSEVQNFGRIFMTLFAPLNSANGLSLHGGTISIYAWMEDVHLAGMTSQPILQGDEYDEASGPVSRPAAILANWATYLEKVPLIGRFATATRLGSSAVSQIATLFGWTNVPVVSSVMPFKNLPFHDLASAEISQPVSKFTLDPKAEISVSPYMVGLAGEDELTVAAIAQRDSYLTQFVWAVTDAPDTLFFSSLVNPLLYDRGTADANNTYSINQTPLCMVARLFRYWRGDIIFTFRIVASKFHRGRLRFHWEPYSTPSTVTDTSHMNMTKIVDIEDTTDIEFRIPYMQPVPWCEHMHQGDIYTTNRWSTTGVKTPSNDDDNGSLVVRCLNSLSAPADTATIRVMVFVRGAENIQFANPIDLTNRFSYIVPQSEQGVEYKTEVDKGTYFKNWGEPILSLRKLLRRSTLVDVVPLLNTAGDSSLMLEARFPMLKYPPPPGYDNSAFNTAKSVAGVAIKPFQYTNMTPFSWVIPSFLALRGGMRWHFNVINNAAHGPSSIAVYRDPGVTLVAPTTNVLVASTSTTNNLFSWDIFNRLVNFASSGVAMTNYEGQPGLSVEMPFMIPYKFFVNTIYNVFKGASFDKSNSDAYKVIVRILNQPTPLVAMERYSSIGTDFNAHFFLRVPTLYYNPDAGKFAS
jgi:hypothetical protein